jgi:hypothetical protein
MRALIVLLALSLVGCSKRAERIPVGQALEKLADAPSRMVLYSLDPPGDHPFDPDAVQTETFHGYDILGRADITDRSEQRALVLALASGAHESDALVPNCFNPRHGLHVDQADHSIDFVICFECHQVQAHGFQREGFFIRTWQQPTFDDSLRRHRIPLAQPDQIPLAPK